MSTKKKGNEVLQKQPPVKPNADQICHMRTFFKQHPFLGTLVPDNEILFECDAEAPAPSKDYGQLQVTLDKVILRWWKITLRNVEGSMYPGEIKDTHEDFYYDETAQREIWRIFGQNILNYCLNLVRGKFDWLVRLPPDIQIRILSFVELDDIPQISLACKGLRALCRNNDLWQIFYARHYGSHAVKNRDLIHLAEQRGWRRVFFTNRLKLQMQLRREAQLERHHPEDPSDFVKARERRAQLQASPPATPRQDRFNQPSIRRHSFATRQGAAPGSPRYDQDESARSYVEGILESPRSRRLQSPALSVRSNAGSTASTGSSQPPAQTSARSTTRR